MKIATISFPGYMERSIGFTIPNNGRFFVASWDDLIYCQLDNKQITEVEEHWKLNSDKKVICIGDQEIPLIGLWSGAPILNRTGLGELQLHQGLVSLQGNGEIQQWQFENFSGDWEQVTFDRERKAFLFGAPYDFDYRYVYLD